MSCKVTIPYSANINDILEMGRREATAYNCQFSGDTSSGAFNVSALGGVFNGTYIVYEKVIEILFSNKPFFIPCSLIETFLRSHVK